MNEKVSFLKFFFESGKFSDSTLTGHIVDLFPAIVYVYDADSGRIRYVNKRFHEFFGTTPNHITDALQIVHPEDVATVESALANLHRLNENDSCTYVNRLQMGDGAWKSFRTQATVLNKRIDGKASAVLFIAQDITEELREQHDNDAFHEILDDTEDLLQFGSWTLDVNSTSMTWSDGLFKLFGCTRQSAPGSISLEQFLNHITAEYRPQLTSLINQSLKYRENFEAEYVVKAKSGIQKIVFTKAKYITDEKHGNRIIGISRDITALRNFEREQERSIRELNRSNRELEEFAYVASHDLQEPIRKVSMFCDRLRAKVADAVDAEAVMFLDRIQSASASMRELVDNLLEYSRANRGTHTFTSIDLDKIFEQVLSDLELKITETQTDIRVEGTLPVIEGIAAEMKQVFTNLISNAIKFRKQNSRPVVTLRTSLLSDGEKQKHNLSNDHRFFRIEIIDNGIGFDAQDSYKIFEIFQRLHSKAAYPGSGIGLSICKKIIENHNGVIFADSIPDQGSTFTIILPENHY
ncbi:MAG TPA: ATP-binding protein [Chryseosolibacter sp.]